MYYMIERKIGKVWDQLLMVEDGEVAKKAYIRQVERCPEIEYRIVVSSKLPDVIPLEDLDSFSGK